METLSKLSSVLSSIYVITVKIQVCSFVSHVLALLPLLHCPVFPVCPADSIEANVENADVNVQRATQQLSHAADYQVKLSRTERMMNRREERQIHQDGIKERNEERRGIQMSKC